MKLAIALVLAVAACGGSSKPATTPEPAPAPEPAPVEAPPPEPEPAAEVAPAPPEPTFPGWYASADAVVALTDDGKATVEGRGKKVVKAKKGTYDKEAGTLTIDKKATPLKLDGESLVVTVGGTEHTLARQPDSFDGVTFANDNGSIQLNADGTCVHGSGGLPSMCTYKLADGKLALTYPKEPKKKAVSWAVWFEPGGKVLHTPKETFTSTTE